MNKTIVIVEDENIIALDIQKRLKSYGYNISAIVPSGEEAIKAAEELRPDLIIMDIILKGEIDGIEAAESISRKSHVPIVYITAFSDQGTMNRLKKSHTPYSVIIKPFNEMELKKIVENALLENASSYNYIT